MEGPNLRKIGIEEGEVQLKSTENIQQNHRRKLSKCKGRYACGDSRILQNTKLTGSK